MCRDHLNGALVLTCPEKRSDSFLTTKSCTEQRFRQIQVELNRGLGTRLDWDWQQILCSVGRILTATSSFVFPRKTFVVAGDSLCDHWLKLMHRRHIKTCPARTDKRPPSIHVFNSSSWLILIAFYLGENFATHAAEKKNVQIFVGYQTTNKRLCLRVHDGIQFMDSRDFEPEARRRIFRSAWFLQRRNDSIQLKLHHSHDSIPCAVELQWLRNSLDVHPEVWGFLLWIDKHLAIISSWDAPSTNLYLK